MTLTLRDDHGEHVIPAGFGRWQPGVLPLGWYGLQPISASGAWANAQTFVAKVAYVETPFIDTYTVQFGEGDAKTVRIEHAINVMGLGPAPRPLPTLTGRVV